MLAALTASTYIKITLLWDIKQWCSMKINRHFGEHTASFFKPSKKPARKQVASQHAFRMVFCSAHSTLKIEMIFPQNIG
jgi:hypothetical protein